MQHERTDGKDAVSRANSTVAEVCRLLASAYPDTDLGNKGDPLEEYIYILLSLRTHAKGLSAAYDAFRRRYPDWEDARRAPVEELAGTISAGGLGLQKAQRIHAGLQTLHATFGRTTMEPLRRWPLERAEAFLLALPGVGVKSARCILMYALGFDVLPVDTHVARVSRRLGWTSAPGTRHVHDDLAQMVPASLRYRFHVCCILHGRAICRGPKPRCNECILASYCAHARRDQEYAGVRSAA